MKALTMAALLGCAGAPREDRGNQVEREARTTAAGADTAAAAAAGADTAAAAAAGADTAVAAGAATAAATVTTPDAPTNPGTPAQPASAASSSPAAAPDRAQRRLTSIGYTTWIWPRPKATGIFIGYIRVGQSVALREAAPVRGEGCNDRFYAVEPRGYVCLDRSATLSPERGFAEVAEATKPGAGPFPYRYAISAGAPMYNRIPTPAEQTRFESRYGPAGRFKPLIKSLSAHEDLAVPTPIAAADAIPPFLKGGQTILDSRMGLVRDTIPNGSMLSFTRSFEAEARTWLLSTDMTIVPADRLRAFRPSAFRGVQLGEGTKLPIAWIRASARPQYRLAEERAPVKTDASWPARSFVRLTGAAVDHKGARYLETADREAGGGGPLYIAETDATVVEAKTKLPAGVARDQKWIHVRITQGTLVAYEGLSPVFATLMSPGSGGVPTRGQDPVRASTTPTGTYYVTFKDRAATMSPDKAGDPRTLWIADVPHTQYFNPPFALHAAYWHERFGEPTSAGCVNVSPLDAEALFAWSDPPVPAEWQGATGSGAPLNGPTTAIVVSR